MTKSNQKWPKTTQKSKVLRTDGPTDGAGCRVACTRLKTSVSIETHVHSRSFKSHLKPLNPPIARPKIASSIKATNDFKGACTCLSMGLPSLQADMRKYPCFVISLKARLVMGLVWPEQVKGVCRSEDILLFVSFVYLLICFFLFLQLVTQNNYQ